MKIITGMHRSGTSIVAKLFHEARANMGNPDTFYPADKWNPDGYFEQPDIHAINMPLINGYLWKFAYFWLPSTQTILKRARSQYGDAIQSTAPKYETAIIKETRFCLTLPAWLEYNTQVDRILVCLREPIQVARSIQKRNYSPLRHGLWLWKIHNQRLLDNVPKDIPIWYINYHNLLNADLYVNELSQAFDFMGVDVTESKVKELLQSHVKPSMNHHAGKTISYPDDIAVLWKNLKEKYHKQMQAQ
jgi:hypothetical protein